MLRTRIPNPVDLLSGVVDDPQGIFGQGSTHTVAVVPFPLIRKQLFLNALQPLSVRMTAEMGSVPHATANWSRRDFT